MIQYPPGVGLVLALLPPGHQVIAMYMLATIGVFGLAPVRYFYARNTMSPLIAGAFGFLTVHLMINSVKASYSMAPTVVVCAVVWDYLVDPLLSRGEGVHRVALLTPANLAANLLRGVK